MNNGLLKILKTNAKRHDVELRGEQAPTMFGNLIEDVSGKSGKVVVLIDDYDNALLASANNRNLYFSEIKDFLTEFFSEINEHEDCVRFIFITGVTRFSKTGVLSEINNLRDITISPKYGTMLGFTKDEMADRFSPFVNESAKCLTNGDAQALLDRFEQYYYGFCFDGVNTVYNPLSTLAFFDSKQFGNYWFDSGEPSMLAEYMKEQHVIVDSFRNMQVPMSFVTDPDELDTAQAVDYLFQNGYLTLRPGSVAGLYALDYPNHEVLVSLSSLMTRNMFGDKRSAEFRSVALSQALTNGDAENVVLEFDALLEKVGYEDYARANGADVTSRHRGIAFGEWLYRALLCGFAAGTGIPVQPAAVDSQGGAAMVVCGQGRTWVVGITVAKTAADAPLAADEAMRQAGETANARSLDNPIRLGIAIDDGIRRIGGYRLDGEPFRAIGATPRPASG
jgi:hypothetical protein